MQYQMQVKSAVERLGIELEVTSPWERNNQTMMRKTIQILREDKGSIKVGGASNTLEFVKKKQAK